MAWLNELALVIGGFLSTSGSVAAGRYRRWPGLQFWGLAELAAFLWITLRAGPDLQRWQLSPFLVGAIAANFIFAVVFWADVLGLPLPIALRLGIGIRTPMVQFNNLIGRTGDRFFAAVRMCTHDPQRCERHLAVATQIVDRLAASRAPDAAWDDCRADIVACHRRMITLTRATMAGEPAEDGGPGSDLEAAYKRTAARRTQLTDAFEKDLGVSGAQYVQRLQVTVAAAAASACALSVGGIVIATQVHLPVSTDPWLWLKSTGVGAAVYLAFFAAGHALAKWASSSSLVAQVVRRRGLARTRRRMARWRP